jgi:hypothetical protein
LDGELDDPEKNKTTIWMATGMVIYTATWTMTTRWADRQDDELGGSREIRQGRDGGREGRQLHRRHIWAEAGAF